MLSTAPVFVFDDDDDDFGGNADPTPTRLPLLPLASRDDNIETAGDLDRNDGVRDDEPQESNVVFLWKEGPWTYSSRRPGLAPAPVVEIDDERGVTLEVVTPSPVTALLANAAHADDSEDNCDIVAESGDVEEDELDAFDVAYVDGVDDRSIVTVDDQDDKELALSSSDAQAEDTVDEGEIVLTSSGCSLQPHRRSANKNAEAPLEIVLTDKACKLKPVSSNVVAARKTDAPQDDMELSTEMPGSDLEESLYFTIGDMIIPSFFAKAAGHSVKTHSVSYDLLPSGWDASIDEISEAFETSSALLVYLASHSDEAAAHEAFKGMSEQHNEAFTAARTKGHCLFAHTGKLDGLFSVAVPVFVDNQAVGAVGIFVPRALTCSDNLEQHLLPQLRLMAAAVAQSSKEHVGAFEAAEMEAPRALAA